jgi:hypothetical protein
MAIGRAAVTNLREIKTHDATTIQEEETEYMTKARENPILSVPLLPIPMEPDMPSSTYFEVPVHVADIKLLLRDLYGKQIEKDRLHSFTAPYPMYNGEILPDKTRIMLTDPNRPISRKFDVMVFEADEYRGTKTVLKYQSTCDDPDEPISELLRDFWFQDILKHIKISPTVFHLSPPTKLLDFKTPKFNFNFDDPNHGITLQECAQSEKSHVRFMLMAKINWTVWQMMNTDLGTQRDQFILGLRLIAQLIPKLKIMHMQKRIIHGDVHSGNVVLLPDNRFGLIDFGLSFFMDEFSGDQQIQTRAKSIVTCVFSHFKLAGSRSSPRDDVYSTLFLAAFLIEGKSKTLYKYCDELENNPDGMYLFQRNSNLFNYSDIIRTIAPAIGIHSPAVIKAIKDHLHMTLVLTRRVSQYNEFPNYDEIVRHARAVYTLINLGVVEAPENLLTVPELDVIHPVVADRIDSRFLDAYKMLNYRVLPLGCKIPREVKLRYMANPVVYDDADRKRMEEGNVVGILSTDNLSALYLRSQFEKQVLSIFGESGIVSRLFPDQKLDSCFHANVSFTNGPHFLLGYSPNLRSFWRIAETGLRLLQTVHSYGAVLGTEHMTQYMTVDVDTKSSLRIAKLPKTFSLFIDPLSNRHVAPCMSGEREEACFSRKTDLMSLVSLLWMVSEDSSKPQELIDFKQYSESLSFYQKPNYFKWIELFSDMHRSAR